MDEKDIKKIVREGYAKVAKQDSSCCGPSASCCDSADAPKDIGKMIGYSEKDLKNLPQGADMGLGCGNPVALASLKEGEVVVDLGSGGGIDCFLASEKVGESGNVIGVDMTPEMIDKARENAEKGGYKNVEFRLGEIDHLPIADNSVDVIISNCVINLAPDKKDVFAEAFRVLKPGGRVMVSDIVLEKELPDFIKQSENALVGCVAGAILKSDYLDAIKAAGFEKVDIHKETTYPVEFITEGPSTKEALKDLGITAEQAKEYVGSIVSIEVSAVKPK
ncbi:MAG: arsenite methyltransferase [Methanobacteriota archaeon]|nr:MAG: arsenite methyltransferase [Euryarchaeota archaeon]